MTQLHLVGTITMNEGGAGSEQGPCSDAPQMKLQVNPRGRHLSIACSLTITASTRQGVLHPFVPASLWTAPQDAEQAGGNPPPPAPPQIHMASQSRKQWGRLQGNPPYTNTLPLHTEIWSFACQTEMWCARQKPWSEPVQPLASTFTVLMLR